MIASFIDGPLWYFSATVFVIGVVWRLFAILRLRGRKKVLSKPRNTAGGGGPGNILDPSAIAAQGMAAAAPITDAMEALDNFDIGGKFLYAILWLIVLLIFFIIA